MALRDTNIDKLGEGVFDVVVLGGGINGAVSAAALSARGARVALLDRGDFAGVTSQESSNLAWGGIKYMESFEFPLVRKLCTSRNLLLRSYPSSVQEIRFYAAHERGFRHGLFKLFLGTWLYWIIGSFFTRIPRLLSRRAIAREEPIVNLDGCDGGFEYSDAYLVDNDARFVWGFVRAALDHGARAANYVESLGARREDGVWVVRARDVMSGRAFTIRARVLVNACGPYVDAHNALSGQETRTHHAFSKGIHLIVDRVTPHRRVLTFFADDGRPFFVIPMGPKTWIGTTDTREELLPPSVHPEDRAFVLENINKRLNLPRPLGDDDILAERCGVRPLVVASSGQGKSDWLQLSRKHEVEVDAAKAHISIFGGKLTDCINVGDEVCDAVQRLGVALPRPAQRWYGEPGEALREEFFHKARALDLDALTPPRASEALSTRLWRRYGAQALGLLEDIRSDPRMADPLIEGADDLRCEVAYAAKHEMIAKLDDFLRRRTKISLLLRREALARSPGLREACRLLFGDEADRRLEEYFQEHGAGRLAEGKAPAAALSAR